MKNRFAAAKLRQ
jgi:hypothetical protein